MLRRPGSERSKPARTDMKPACGPPNPIGTPKRCALPTATKYIGLTIEWDCKNQKVHTSMPGYLSKAFVRFKHEIPHKKQNSRHPHLIPNYRAKAQLAEPEEDLPILGTEEIKFIQAVTGVLSYYGRVVDSTILPSLSSLATEQAKPTAKTKATVSSY